MLRKYNQLDENDNQNTDSLSCSVEEISEETSNDLQKPLNAAIDSVQSCADSTQTSTMILSSLNLNQLRKGQIV